MPSILITSLQQNQRKLLFILLLFTNLISIPQAAFGGSADDIIGTWITEDHKGWVQIYRCGRLYCGKIVCLSEPCYPLNDEQGMGGRPRVDRHNPNPDLRDRPALGLIILEDFTFTGCNTWERGTVYDPESGRVYKGKITLKSPNILKLRGYIGFSLFGRTTLWKRTKPID